MPVTLASKHGLPIPDPVPGRTTTQSTFLRKDTETWHKSSGSAPMQSRPATVLVWPVPTSLETSNMLLSLSLPSHWPRLQREVEDPSRQGSPYGWLAVLTQEEIDAVEVVVSPYTPGAFCIAAVATGGAAHPTRNGCRLLANEAGGGAGSLPHVCLF